MALIAELKRRNVFRVGAVYVVACWLILQAADIILPALGMPDWTITFLLALMGLGFPLALVFAWAFELTPDGVHRTGDVPPEQSITRATGRRLDRIVIAVLAVAVTLLLVDRFLIDSVPETQQQAPATASNAKRIAVLPFTNMSDDAGNEYFSDGIAEEILHLLSRVDGLRVSSRTSAFALRGQQLDLPTIAQRLNVDHVLEGSVRRAGDRVRITAQLIDVATDSHLWSQTYERELEDLFAIQTEISRSIVDALQIALGTGDAQLLTAATPTVNLAAYEAYLQGRHLMARRGEGPVRQAIDRFQSAISLDPEFGHAYAGLAAANLMLLVYANEDRLQVQLVAAEAAARALALDDTHAETYAVLGDLERLSKGNWLASERHYQRALELEPSSQLAHLWYAEMLSDVGRQRDAMGHAETALALDPLNPGGNAMVGGLALQLGDPDRAERLAKTAADLGHPDMAGLLTAARAAQGNWSELEQDLIGYARARNEPLEMAAAALAALRDGEQKPITRQLLADLVERGEMSEDALGFWTQVYDDSDFIYQNMDEILREVVNIATILWNPTFNRSDPRFKELTERLKLPAYWAVAGPPDVCRYQGDDLVCD